MSILSPSFWNNKRTALINFTLAVVCVVLINYLASGYFFRIDLTEEKRYTISDATKKMLKGINDQVYVEIYLDGDELPPGFKRLQRSIRETLDEFNVYSGARIEYRFVSPDKETDEQKRTRFYRQLAGKGVQPTNLFSKEESKSSELLVFPGAVLAYKNQELAVNFLKGTTGASPEEVLNESVEGVEFELASALQKLALPDKKWIGFTEGHGELTDADMADILRSLDDKYKTERINPAVSDLSKYALLVMARPTERFTDSVKFKLDQYIIKGGKMAFFIDKARVNLDSLGKGGAVAVPYDLNLDDLLFRYGVRINNNLVQDGLLCGQMPVVVGYMGNQPNVQLVPWKYHPLPNKFATHPAVRNLSAVYTKYISSIDTVKAEGINKIPLMFTSPYTRLVALPRQVSFDELKQPIKPEEYTGGHIPVAVLLEGKFTSLFRHRLSVEKMAETGFKEKDQPTKIVVCSDADLLRNEILPNGEAMPAGFDRYMRKSFANKELVNNLADYMTDQDGLISVRAREIKLRPLDKIKTREESAYWQMLNVAVPLLLLVLFGIGINYRRRRKYALK